MPHRDSSHVQTNASSPRKNFVRDNSPLPSRRREQRAHSPPRSTGEPKDVVYGEGPVRTSNRGDYQSRGQNGTGNSKNDFSSKLKGMDISEEKKKYEKKYQKKYKDRSTTIPLESLFTDNKTRSRKERRQEARELDLFDD